MLLLLAASLLACAGAAGAGVVPSSAVPNPQLCVASTPAPVVPAPTPTPAPGHPAIVSISNPVLAGGNLVIDGRNFSKGAVVNLFVAQSSGLFKAGPLKPIPGGTTTRLVAHVPATVSQGQGFVAVEVVNTENYAASNPAYGLLQGLAAAGLPSITAINGKPLAASSINPDFATANVETTLLQGGSVVLSGSGFDTVNGVAVDVFCACPGGKLATRFLDSGNPDLKPDSIRFALPATAPTGPGSITVSNAGPRKSYSARSAAVSVPIGQRINIVGVTRTGGTLIVTGTGFSTRTVINFFNAQAAGVVNLGGLNRGTPKIALRVLGSTEFTFALPANAVPGPMFVQALNPPFLAFTSTGNNPCGALAHYPSLPSPTPTIRLMVTPTPRRTLAPTPRPTPTPRRTTAPTARPTAVAVVHLRNLPPKATLPAESNCAALANHSNFPETSPDNVNDGTGWNANHQIWTTPPYFYANAGRDGLARSSDFARVDGKYAGSTQDIIRWAACKWGVDEDWAYAETAEETGGWTNACAQLHGGTTCSEGGDCGNPDIDSGGESPNLRFLGFQVTNGIGQFIGPNAYGGMNENGSPCPSSWASWSIIQSKANSFEWYTWPMLAISTAWGEDYRWAKYRACVNGDYANFFGNSSDYLNAVARATSNPNGLVLSGQLGPVNLFTKQTNLQYLALGCIATHFSGDWYDGGAVGYLTNSGSGFLYHLNGSVWPGGRR